MRVCNDDYCTLCGHVTESFYGGPVWVACPGAEANLLRVEAAEGKQLSLCEMWISGQVHLPNTTGESCNIFHHDT